MVSLFMKRKTSNQSICEPKEYDSTFSTEDSSVISSKQSTVLRGKGLSVSNHETRREPRRNLMSRFDSFRTSRSLYSTDSMSPHDYLNVMILKKRGYATKQYETLSCGYYNEPTPFQEASWSRYVLTLAKNNDIPALRRLFMAGISNNPSNYFGVTLAHCVSKVGNIDVLKLMIEFGCDVRVADSRGRTPLHEACSASDLNFPLIELIVKQDCRLFHMTDMEGSAPLDLVPNHYWNDWNRFLKSKRDQYWPRRDISVSGEQPSPSLTLLKANGRGVDVPKNSMSIDDVIAVASGRPMEYAKVDINDTIDSKSIVTISETLDTSSNHSTAMFGFQKRIASGFSRKEKKHRDVKPSANQIKRTVEHQKRQHQLPPRPPQQQKMQKQQQQRQEQSKTNSNKKVSVTNHNENTETQLNQVLGDLKVLLGDNNLLSSKHQHEYEMNAKHRGNKQRHYIDNSFPQHYSHQQCDMITKQNNNNMIWNKHGDNNVFHEVEEDDEMQQMQKLKQHQHQHRPNDMIMVDQIPVVFANCQNEIQLPALFDGNDSISTMTRHICQTPSFKIQRLSV